VDLSTRVNLPDYPISPHPVPFPSPWNREKQNEIARAVPLYSADSPADRGCAPHGPMKFDVLCYPAADPSTAPLQKLNYRAHSVIHGRFPRETKTTLKNGFSPPDAIEPP